MPMKDLYDGMSSNYISTRHADPRVGQWLQNALGTAQSVLNVGAGTGNYEPPGRRVVAVEPSAEMIAKRPPNTGPALRAAAEDLPFPSRCLNVWPAVGPLSVHLRECWTFDVRAGEREKQLVRWRCGREPAE
jgi:SAM-dependent methyltransferase